jgi:hypothetical protein
MQLMKTSCGTSAVMQGTQHEGASCPREFFAFMSGDDPASIHEPEAEDLSGSDDTEEESDSDNGYET